MRIFKFRGWHKADKVMVDMEFLSKIRYGKNKLNNGVQHDNIFNDPDYVLQQYLGFVDRKGIEIYEGDIVTDVNNQQWSSSIQWGDVGYYLDVRHHCDRDLIELVLDNRLIVIGNNYEKENGK